MGTWGGGLGRAIRFCGACGPAARPPGARHRCWGALASQRHVLLWRAGHRFPAPPWLLLRSPAAVRQARADQQSRPGRPAPGDKRVGDPHSWRSAAAASFEPAAWARPRLVCRPSLHRPVPAPVPAPPAPQEDSHIAQHISDTCHIFGVFDGHGGPEVARFCSKRMPAELQRQGGFQSSQYEEGLKQVGRWSGRTLVVGGVGAVQLAAAPWPACHAAAAAARLVHCSPVTCHLGSVALAPPCPTHRSSTAWTS